ncbi:Acg family FMN-binding oxidoreductase [Methylocystis sp. H62]|uniref:Acg family FMN-binding oxidoreductase n=1 Tax=Methylocystis sp. H62 TaxID=2785789 RepID=UPI001AEDA00B|nr:Tat pathway signal protein [Methylocystis sp. H62]
MTDRSYAAAASRLRTLPRPGDGNPMQALVHAATLAASSHNTQPWSFRIDADAITISPDFSRRCPVVDPDDSHLFKSLGCAAENLAAAAPAYGLAPDIRIESDGRVVVGLTKTAIQAGASALKAIAERQCTKSPYDGSALAPSDSSAIESAGMGIGVRVLLIDDAKLKETILDCVNEGNRTQLSDPAFRRELIHWIRFNDAAAIGTGDGLGGRPSGQPQLPAWLAKPLMGFVLTPKSQMARDTENLRSSAGIAVFIGERDNVQTSIETGRSYERFALAATERGIRNAFINQPIEVRRLRPQLHAALGLKRNEVAHLMVRYGRGPLAPYSLRRPITDVQSK